MARTTIFNESLAKGTPHAAGTVSGGIQALLRNYKTRFHLAQPEVARLTVSSPRTVAKWVGGEKPSPRQQKAIVEMDRLLDGLSRIMEPADIGRWLKNPNQAFDGSTPLQVIERGESDRIWRMLYYIESGSPG